MKITFWKDGDENRPGRLYRPCQCGCDERDGKMAGYYSRSDSDGNGMTIVYETEAEYQGAAGAVDSVFP